MTFKSWTSGDISSNLTDGCVFLCVCVWWLFAHGDKQLLCTWPRPKAKDGTWPHGAFSPAAAQHITCFNRKQPVCIQRPPSYMCLPGHIFRAWHSSPHTCQHFLSLSSLFSWMQVMIVLITSQCAAEISQRTAHRTSSLIDVRSHGEDKDGEGRGADSHSRWPLRQGSMTVWALVISGNGVDFVRLLKNPQFWPLSGSFLKEPKLMLNSPEKHWGLTVNDSLWIVKWLQLC